MKPQSPFPPKTVLWLLSVILVLLALSILLGDYKIEQTGFRERVGPGAFSTSAIGYAGFYETLRRLDWPVRRGARGMRAAARKRGVLVLAEPDPEHRDWEEMIRRAEVPRILVVLPKWRGIKDPDNPTWVKDIVLVPAQSVNSLLTFVPATAAVVRRPWPGAWKTNALGVEPAGTGAAQLVRSSRLRPIVGDDDGMLVGELRHGDHTVWVLSDPDVMANHGIVRGDNLRFMTALFQSLARPAGTGDKPPVFFDETVHGFQEYMGSPIRLLWLFPYGVVTILLCVAVVLIVLAGAGRFGGVQPPAPTLAFGKAHLIENSARLILDAGYSAETLWRYLYMNMRQVAAELHAPPGLDDAQLAKWLDAAGKTRPVNLTCSEILRMASENLRQEHGGAARLLETVHEMYAWKREMIHGVGTNRGNRP